ncbi:SirB2 family protein [beta proteobacterium MWH-UniP1]
MLYFWLYKIHITSVILSVSLFVARGLGVQLKQAWPMQAMWRRLSVLIDVVLLSAGSGLWWAVSHNPLNEPWLALKLFLVVVYIVLGSFALKRAKTLNQKRIFFAMALITIFWVAAIALSRDPLFGL